jgi:hypothetical protein
MLAEIVWNADTIMFGGIFSLPIVTVIAYYWYKVNQTRSDNELKQRMVDRGMSAAEIEQVLAAKSKDEE